MQKIMFVVFLMTSFLTPVLSQSGKSSFYPEGYGRLHNREHVYFLSINTENTTDSFFLALKKQMGAPAFTDGYDVYHIIRPQWSKEKAVIQIQHVLQTDLNKKTSHTLFISVETKSGKDLLKPGTKSYERIKDFFKKLYNQTILNAVMDDFKDKVFL